MNWKRIFAVSGTAFFTTLGGLLTVDGLTNNIIPLNILVPSSLISAGIQGMIALCREINDESPKDKPENKITRCLYGFGIKGNTIGKILNSILIW